MEKEISKLIIRYKNKIVWLQEHFNDINKQEYEGIIQGLLIAIHDLIDMLDGISM